MVELLFLPSIYSPCPTCHGTRFKESTLEITWHDRNIADVLAMSVDEALKYVISMGVVVPPLREPRPGEPVTAQVPGVTGPKAAAPAAEALPPVNHPMADPAIARPEL